MSGWFARDAGESKARQAIVIALFVGDVLGFVVALLGLAFAWWRRWTAFSTLPLLFENPIGRGNCKGCPYQKMCPFRNVHRNSFCENKQLLI